MKTKHTFISLLSCMAILLLAGCNKEMGSRVVFPDSQPEMSGLTVSATNGITATDSLYFSVNISDEKTPLSTLEVMLSTSADTIYTASIRTKGNSASISQYGIYIPFNPGMEDTDATLTLTAINVEGSTQTTSQQVRLLRPTLPETLYLHYNGETLPLYRQAANPFEYVSDEGEYPTQWTGKISTSPTTEASDYIWGFSETVNIAAMGTPTGVDFTFNYEDWVITNITFNTLTFRVGAIGTFTRLEINGTQLEAGGGYYSGAIQFTQGAAVTFDGFEDLANAYNRDFFSYDPDTDTYTFLRSSGTWQVYYSGKYNYMWMVHSMDDVAPTAFWVVGHGFTQAPVWNEEYGYGGWGLEDISWLGYIVRTGDHTYQTSLYLNNQHEWGSFEIEFYSDRVWNKTNGILLQAGAITGDTEGIVLSASNGITSADGFVPGYYRLTFDTSAGVGQEKLHIERLSN
jgi:hypothetical protein